MHTSTILSCDVSQNISPHLKIESAVSIIAKDEVAIKARQVSVKTWTTLDLMRSLFIFYGVIKVFCSVTEFKTTKAQHFVALSDIGAAAVFMMINQLLMSSRVKERDSPSVSPSLVHWTWPIWLPTLQPRTALWPSVTSLSTGVARKCCRWHSANPETRWMFGCSNCGFCPLFCNLGSGMGGYHEKDCGGWDFTNCGYLKFSKPITQMEIFIFLQIFSGLDTREICHPHSCRAHLCPGANRNDPKCFL